MDYIINLNVNSFTELLYTNRTVCLALGAASLYLYYFFKRPYNLPPGPYGLPIVGSGREITDDIPSSLRRLGKKYGDIFTLWLGGDKYVVVLNNYTLMKDAFLTRGAEFSDRIPGKTVGGLDIHEPIFNGHYDSNHRLCSKIVSASLRKYSTTSLDGQIERELAKVCQYPDVKNGHPVEIASLMKLVMTNIFLDWQFSTSYEYDDKELQRVIKGIEEYGHCVGESFNNVFRTEHIFRTRKTYKGRCTSYIEYIKKQVEQHKKTLDKNNIRDLTDEFLINDLFDKYSDDTVHMLMMLIVDAVVTVTMVINWEIAYYSNYPQHAARIREEIRQLNLQGGPVKINDRKDMPFTEAFLMEMSRIRNILQITVPRCSDKDNTFHGYNIPKNTMMVGNLDQVLKDEVLFPDPDTFKPERFFKDGKVVVKEGNSPFGIGRRSCIGETISRSCLFLLFTNIVNIYDITASVPLKTEGSLTDEGIFKMLDNFKVILKEKKC